MTGFDPPNRTLTITVLSLSLLFSGLIIDLTSPQGLVVAIIYDIPIALSGLALSRRLTVSVVLLALINNGLAAYVNATSTGSYDTLTLLNRGLSGLSFLLVGTLTLALRNASARVTRLAFEEERAQREFALRRLLSSLSGPLQPDTLLRKAVTELRDLLQADAVVIAALEAHRFAAPRYSSPDATGVALTGTVASWAVDALPTGEASVITVRSDQGPKTVGRWRRQNASDLIGVVDRPRSDEASLLLREVLMGLEPLLERARLLERLRDQRPEQA